MNDQMPNVEQVIAGMRDETIREIGKDTISAAAQVAWYWSYIGALDMAQQLGLIDDTRCQELYHEAETFKPVCEVRAVQSGDYPAAAEMSAELNYNQIDGIINNKAPLESENEALYLVGGAVYLHIQTSEDDRDYTHDDCFATYDYILYDKETMRQLDSGRMEVVADIRDTPSQIHRLAAQNILECRTILGASSIEPVPMDILDTLHPAVDAITNDKAPKPSLLATLRQCREDAGKSQGGTAPPAPAVPRRGETMQLTNIERETIINFNEAERTASVYTCNEALKRQLLELCQSHPEQVRQTADNGRGGLSFALPKKWLKVSPPRVLSPAQRAVLERMNQAQQRD